MKKISDILANCRLTDIKGNTEQEIGSLSFDSRKVDEQTMFFAIRGTQVDGHQFIDSAIRNGVKAVVCETLPENITEGVSYFVTENASETLGIAASNFYDNPSHRLRLTGVTGTNGKTTIATLLYRLFSDAGYVCGLLSTIENIVDREVIPSTHTTPDPIELNQLLDKMVKKGCEMAFMEVSSHAVEQNRIAGLKFTGGIFTNLTHDHLDYHKTMANYRNAKKKFFDNLPADAFALTNSDDKNGLVMLQNTKAKKKTYALKHDADFKGIVVESHFNGMLMKINGKEVFTRLVGGFNASNLLAIYGTAILLGFDEEELLVEISRLQGANGRFDMVHTDKGIVGIVDYAHTPDALKNVLSTISEVRKSGERIITVAGCGGNRDTTKRPEMAAIAAEMSDMVILTSDNPRFEDPDEIIQQMKKGLTPEQAPKVLSITNRHEAIRTAVALAKKGDIILVAGKGHETYQDTNGVKTHFDDKEELTNAFNEK